MKSSKTYFRALPVDLTPEEFDTKSNDLADICQEINRAKDAAKEEARMNKEAIDKLEATRSKLAHIVKDRAEERQVECVDQHQYARHAVESVRMDTGEVIGTRAMTVSEYQEEMNLHGSVLPFPQAAQG